MHFTRKINKSWQHLTLISKKTTTKCLHFLCQAISKWKEVKVTLLSAQNGVYLFTLMILSIAIDFQLSVKRLVIWITQSQVDTYMSSQSPNQTICFLSDIDNRNNHSTNKYIQSCKYRPLCCSRKCPYPSGNSNFASYIVLSFKIFWEFPMTLLGWVWIFSAITHYKKNYNKIKTNY